MYKVINFAISLMEKQNSLSFEFLPSQNSNINSSQNPKINKKRTIFELFTSVFFADRYLQLDLLILQFF